MAVRTQQARGFNALEDDNPGGNNNTRNVVQSLAGISPGILPQYYADQTAALQLGHFATKAVLGAWCARRSLARRSLGPKPIREAS
jgi:hypothetical protein